jgi:hypothetical protein
VILMWTRSGDFLGWVRSMRMVRGKRRAKKSFGITLLLTGFNRRAYPTKANAHVLVSV